MLALDVEDVVLDLKVELMAHRQGRRLTCKKLLIRVQVRPSTNSSFKTHALFLCVINPRGKF